MQDQAVAGATQDSSSLLKKAVYRNSAISKQGLLERLFTAVFDNLVYPQIWEDPQTDLQALAIQPGHHLVTISSGGCNVLSYLTADLGRITAVDLNPAHLALTRLKLAAICHLPSYEDFRRFFAEAESPVNVALYDRLLAPQLDVETRGYWSGRDLFRARRIRLFTRNIYRHGMLGYFIYLAHLVGKLYGIDPTGMMQAESLQEQRRFFETELAPLFDKKLLRWLTSSPISLYGLGIPPAQYTELAEGRHMADVLRERLEKLSCVAPLKENYFARQAFGCSYGAAKRDAALPLYLEQGNWEMIRARVDRVETHNRSVTEVLTQAPGGSVDRVVLLDAQDWMGDAQLNDLWCVLTHAAAPGARVIVRSAAAASPLETRPDAAVLSRWRYQRDASRRYLAQDRSAIYGGFHLYLLAE